MRAAPLAAALAGLLAALLGGCGGVPTSPTSAAAAVVEFVAYEGTDAKAPLISSTAVVIIGGVRGTFSGPKGVPLTLTGIPFGTQTPPTQPMTVTAPGYATLSQQLPLQTTAITYVEVSMTKVDLTQTGTLQGTVTSTTGTPVPNALIAVSWGAGGDGNTIQGFTDNAGGFIIGGIPLGPVTVAATATGYLSAQQTANVQPDSGGTNAPLTFSLLSGGTTVNVPGVVTDVRTDQPLAGVSVSVDSSPAVTTGSNGRFSVPGILVGSHTIHARLSGYDDFDTAITVLPGMSDVAIVMSRTSATPPGVPYTIAGTVTLRGAADNSGATVTAYNLDRAEVMATYVTGADGRYYLFVPAGRYQITVTVGSHTITSDLTYPGGGRIMDGVDFTLTVGASAARVTSRAAGHPSPPGHHSSQ